MSNNRMKLFPTTLLVLLLMGIGCGVVSGVKPLVALADPAMMSSDGLFLPPSTTTTDGDSKVESKDGAPKVSDNNLDDTAIVDAIIEGALTQQERDAIANGAEASLQLVLSPLQTIPSEDSAAVDQVRSDYTNYVAFDASLILQITGRDDREIKDTVREVTFTVNVPDNIATAPTDMERTFYLIHINHEGKVIVVKSSKSTTLQGSTTEFSTWLIAYKDEPIKSDSSSKAKSGSSKKKASSSKKETTSPASKWSTVAGAGRYQTMADAIMASFSRSDWAVLSSGADFPDALASSSLAGVLGCPVVTTAQGVLTAEAADVLSRLGVTHAIVVGGESSVSGDVLSALASMGIEVTRVAGDSRASTSLAVLKQNQLMGGSSDTVILATGTTFADVLSAGPLAYLNESPVVLTEGGVLSEEALKAIAEGGYAKAVVLGGAASVSPEVEAQLQGIGVAFERLAGADRYETSVAVATYASAHGLGLAHPTAASGTGFSDSLVGAPFAARKGGVLLLVSEGSTAAEDLLRLHKAEFVSGTVLGGTDLVSDVLVERLEDAVA